MKGTQQAPHHHNANLPGPAPNTAGPHRQDWLNRLDPTVDSMTTGIQVTGPGVHGTGHGRGPAAAPHAQHSVVGGAAAAPGHDGDANGRRPFAGDAYSRHGSAAPGIASPATTGVGEGMHGPHDSRAANSLDPRVDSDMHGGADATMHGGAGPYPGAASAVGSGPAPKTAGRHASDWANRLDPTVDSKPRHGQAGVRNI